eukprot:5361495-Pyramimonas_sp.AAC.1
MSNGGRRVPRPPALAPTGRTLGFCHLARGNLHSFLRRWLRAQGALASPAARLPRTAVDPAVWPLQHLNDHRIIVILVRLSLRIYGQLALNSELVVTCVTYHTCRGYDLYWHT